MCTSTPLISVIVPIYNADKYLHDCLASIAAQTYKNIEAILINDGSTDNSEVIAKYFCKQDARFKLISQANAGVAAARQAGLTVAQGRYVIHTDADDLMIKSSLSNMYQSIGENNANIVIGDYLQKTHNSEQLYKHHLTDKKSYMQALLLGRYHASLWNKLISMELCKDITFLENINYMEDKLFLFKVLSKKEAVISVVNEVVYVYNFVSSSYTNNISQESMHASIRVTEELCQILSKEFSEPFINHIVNKNKVTVLLNSTLTQRKVHTASNKYILSDQYLPTKHKILIILDLFYFNFLITCYKRLKSNAKHPSRAKPL